MLWASGRIERRWVCVAVLVGTLALFCPAVASAGTTLDPPTSLYQSNQSDTSVTVSWTPSDSSGVTGYEIWPNGGAKVDVGAGATSYTMTGLTCGRAAWFEVWAFDAAGDMSPGVSTEGYAPTTAPCEADLQVLSDTPSVSHAQVGQDVTFTIVARNNGPLDTVDPGVEADFASGGLSFDAAARCGGVGPDGTQCEYDGLAPSETVTETIVAQVQDTSSGYATDVACVRALDETNYDPHPGNDCGIATVAIDHPAAASTPPVVSPVASAGGPTHTPPPPSTGRSQPADAGSCSAYTRQGRRYTILTHRKLACAQGRAVIRHADGAWHRTGVYVRVSSWLCRRVHLAGRQVMWLDDCTQAGGQQVIWTEQRRRLKRG